MIKIQEEEQSRGTCTCLVPGSGEADGGRGELSSTCCLAPSLCVITTMCHILCPHLCCVETEMAALSLPSLCGSWELRRPSCLCSSPGPSACSGCSTMGIAITSACPDSAGLGPPSAHYLWALDDDGKLQSLQAVEHSCFLLWSICTWKESNRFPIAPVLNS